MYSFDWNAKTGGYVLNTKSARFVASEIRPVFAEELKLVGFDAHFKFDANETRPICWAKQNLYLYRGEEIARLEKTQYGRPLSPVFAAKKGTVLKPVDVEAMLADEKNRALMDALVADTLKRLKEMFDQYARAGDIAYIGFSGGKDSVLLLDLCHRALPLSVPVVFSDTDMELPDTYAMWDAIQTRYPDRPFIRAKAGTRAIDNWRLFGPPSRTVRWCCSVHKSTPAILALRELTGRTQVRAAAFLGVRAEESLTRAEYDEIGVGVKNASQVNAYPILKWSAHELWLYTFAENLPVNRAYRQGLPRVGCILCPEASEKYAWFVNAVYPDAIAPYNAAILDTVDKPLRSKKEREDYLATAGWQARKSGETLKEKIARPVEKIVGDTVEWSFPAYFVPRIHVWLNTLGAFRSIPFRDETHIKTVHFFIDRKANGTTKPIEIEISTTDPDAPLAVRDPTNIATMRAKFESLRDLRDFSKFVRQCIFKAFSCVGCRACEVECPTGALSFSGTAPSINSTKCIHCLNCHSADLGCWRYQSMRTAEATNSELATINKYKNFGLRESWLSVFASDGPDFAHTPQLGNKMIESAKAWFRQALLMDEKSFDPLPLMGLIERHGADSKLLWDCIWIALANRAAIVKWLVTQLELGRWYTRDEQFALLGADIKDATKKGGISALNDTLTKSPLGTGSVPLVAMQEKGRSVVALMRKTREPEPLALLFGLFVMAETANRNAFSVSAMMTADATAPFVSPLAAFGLGPEAFKRLAAGLADRYPAFLRVRFAQGLDEVEVFRGGEDGKTHDDVVRLMLEA